MNQLVWLLILVLDIVALVDIYKSAMDSTKKALWFLGVLIFPVVGMVVWFLVGKKS